MLMFNVNFEAMKDKIEKILEEYKIEGAKKDLMAEEFLNLHSVSNTLFVNQDKDGFTLSMHKTEFGAKKDRDERRIEDENVNTYEVTLFQ